jgi:hypothetical protein
MSEVTNELRVLGDSLQRAWRAEHRRRANRRARRRLVLIAACAILLIAGGVAVGSRILKSEADVETGLLGGHLLFNGTHPKCRQLSATSFVCRLDRVPKEVPFHRANEFLGVKTATVDSQRRVDGGCVATKADGRTWRCYLGQEAVRQGIISDSFLGKHLPETPIG